MYRNLRKKCNATSEKQQNVRFRNHRCQFLCPKMPLHRFRHFYQKDGELGVAGVLDADVHSIAIISTFYVVCYRYVHKLTKTLLKRIVLENNTVSWDINKLTDEEKQILSEMEDEFKDYSND